MKLYYAVTYLRGENWNPALPMRQQENWDEHARLMDALVEAGFIILGGPLDEGEKVLMIINAESPQAIDQRLAQDPWMPMGLRRIASIERWQVLLGG